MKKCGWCRRQQGFAATAATSVKSNHRFRRARRMPRAHAGFRLSFAVMAESRHSFVTPEPPRTVPLATVLHGLCSPGLAEDLVRTLRAIERLAPDDASASDAANAPPDGASQREAIESRLRSDLARDRGCRRRPLLPNQARRVPPPGSTAAARFACRPRGRPARALHDGLGRSRGGVHHQGRKLRRGEGRARAGAVLACRYRSAAQHAALGCARELVRPGAALRHPSERAVLRP